VPKVRANFSQIVFNEILETLGIDRLENLPTTNVIVEQQRKEIVGMTEKRQLVKTLVEWLTLRRKNKDAEKKLQAKVDELKAHVEALEEKLSETRNEVDELTAAAAKFKQELREI
jgi:uncharacterized coiled-coil DUF342 family protein